MQARLSISGMHCASCVSKVENALMHVDSVTHVSVNLSSGDAVIDYEAATEDSQALVSEMIQAVLSAGYGAAIPGSERQQNGESLRKLGTQVVVGLVLSVTIVLLTVLKAPNWVLLVCSVPVQFWCGASFLGGLFGGLRRREVTMDTLVGLGTLSAWGYSAAITLIPALRSPGSPGSGDVYFEIAAFLVSFVLLGRLLEGRAKSRTQSAIQKLVALLPPQAHVIRKTVVDLPLSEVLAGDILLVKPGERIPVDGVITEGFSAIDESTLTGESIPVEKGPNQSVSAGTLNTTGSFEMRATRVGEATVLAQIVETVRRAQASKAPIQRYADTAASYFVPIVILLALVTFLAWIFLSHDFGASLLSAISVLIISCPCALGLATPVAIIVAMGKATERGILIRDAKALETLGKAKTIIFDKTGTLTQARPELVRTYPLGDSLGEDDSLLWSASAETASEHLLARAIVDGAKARQLKLRKIDRFKSYPGGGIEARIEGRLVLVGSGSFLAKNHVETRAFESLSLSKPGSMWIAAAMEGKLLAAFEIIDPPRDEASHVLSRLRSLGIRALIVSGDHPATVGFIGKNLHFRENEIFGGISPTEKASKIGMLRSSSAVSGAVVMVGDGVNDAPALAQADVGIAMGTGADIAVESASVTLLHHTLTGVTDAYLLSRQTMKTIRQNLFASFFYNALGIPIAAGVLYPWTGWRLNPMIAGGAMALSSVSVVLNGLRLKRWNWGASRAP